MKSVGIKNLKDNLSSYMDFVKKGETIIVLDRNHPIAEIRKFNKSLDLTTQYIQESTKDNSIIPAKIPKKIKIPKSFLSNDKLKKTVSLTWKEAYSLDRD